MDAQALSEQSLREWDAVATSMGTDASRPLDRELLNRFLIGVHRRGEELSAHDLALLVGELDVQPELARELVSFIEAGLALLEDYDRLSPEGDDEPAAEEDDDDDMGGRYVGDADVGPGILVN